MKLNKNTKYPVLNWCTKPMHMIVDEKKTSSNTVFLIETWGYIACVHGAIVHNLTQHCRHLQI